MPDTSKLPDDPNALPFYSHEVEAHETYDEYVCYGVEQVKLRYLFRIHMSRHPITL
jgi:hypothetical protein